MQAGHKAGLQTFSIGFRDEKFFDETNYARLVAKHFNTEHTVFSLSNSDLYEHVEGILDYIDEPFADSSAINVYILSRETRKHSTVALSGDGADELFGGYHKHEAMNRMVTPGVKERALLALAPLWKALPQSRSTPTTNFFRQAHRFAAGAKLSPSERYWRWAVFADVGEATGLLAPKIREQLSMDEYARRKTGIVSTIPATHDLNHILSTDMKLVLANDMLTKVDSMSMAHGLEVRSPFLDYTLVDFAFTLPAHYKVNGNRRKRILQDTFRDMLPTALYNRPKKGFEVPLLKWFQKEMRTLIVDDLLSPKVIAEQGLFHYPEVERLKQKLFSRNPGDVHARIWALVVFQWWLRKFGGKG